MSCRITSGARYHRVTTCNHSTKQRVSNSAMKSYHSHTNCTSRSISLFLFGKLDRKIQDNQHANTQKIWLSLSFIKITQNNTFYPIKFLTIEYLHLKLTEKCKTYNRCQCHLKRIDSSKPKVCKFELSLAGYKNILRFQISMYNSVSMQKIHSIKQL